MLFPIKISHLQPPSILVDYLPFCVFNPAFFAGSVKRNSYVLVFRPSKEKCKSWFLFSISKYIQAKIEYPLVDYLLLSKLSKKLANCSTSYNVCYILREAAMAKEWHTQFGKIFSEVEFHSSVFHRVSSSIKEWLFFFRQISFEVAYG